MCCLTGGPVLWTGLSGGGLDAERGQPQLSKALPCDQTEGLRLRADQKGQA